MDLRLRGKRVIITGASQGIGLGLAHAFAKEGCDLVLIARSADKLTLAAEQITQAQGVTVETIAVDLTQPASVARLADAGDVDILVNNAGAIRAGSIAALGADEWRAGWDLKVFGYIDLCRLFLGRMIDRGEGVIINNIGASANYLDPKYIAGSTGNAALVALTRALGSRSLDQGVRVLGVNPGPVATDRIERLLREGAGSAGGKPPVFPLGRPASVEEIADLIVFLASPRSAYTSGVVIDIDGGLSARHSM